MSLNLLRRCTSVTCFGSAVRASSLHSARVLLLLGRTSAEVHRRASSSTAAPPPPALPHMAPIASQSLSLRRVVEGALLDGPENPRVMLESLSAISGILSSSTGSRGIVDGEDLSLLGRFVKNLDLGFFRALSLDECVSASRHLLRLLKAVPIAQATTNIIITGFREKIVSNLPREEQRSVVLASLRPSALPTGDDMVEAELLTLGSDVRSVREAEEAEGEELKATPVQAARGEELTWSHINTLVPFFERIRCNDQAAWDGLAYCAARHAPLVERGAMKKISEKLSPPNTAFRQKVLNHFSAAVLKYDKSFLFGVDFAQFFINFAHVGFKSKRFLDAVAGRILSDIAVSRTHHLCSLINAMGSVCIVPTNHRPFIKAILDELLKRENDFLEGGTGDMKYLAGGLARLRIRDDRVLQLAERALKAEMKHRKVERNWNTSIVRVARCFAVLGYRPSEELIGNMYAETFRLQSTLSKESILSLLWSFSAFGALDHRCKPLIKIITSEPPRDFIHQYQFAQIMSSMDGTALPQEKSTMEVCFKRRLANNLSRALNSQRSSSMTAITDFQRSVGKAFEAALKTAGLQHLDFAYEERIPGSVYLIDIAIESHKIAIESEGPWHFADWLSPVPYKPEGDEQLLMGNSRGDATPPPEPLAPLGNVRLKHRFLVANGWSVVHIPYWIWTPLSDEDKVKYITKVVIPLLQQS